MAIQAKSSTRPGRSQHERQFKALAAFANMGDKPEDWRKFRLRWPDFFPTTDSGFSEPGFRNLDEWLYTAADHWAKLTTDLDPASAWVQTFKTPLLFFRDRLRAVWARNDPNGANLTVLLGLVSEQEATKTLGSGLGTEGGIIRPAVIPGTDIANLGRDEPIGGLPRGRPIVNGSTGEIRWEFGCAFQQAIYELMQRRWRAMICPQCGNYFVAAKTAQKHCSQRCYREFKNKRSLDYWHLEGSKRRDERLKKAKAARRRRTR